MYSVRRFWWFAVLLMFVGGWGCKLYDANLLEVDVETGGTGAAGGGAGALDASAPISLNGGAGGPSPGPQAEIPDASMGATDADAADAGATAAAVTDAAVTDAAVTDAGAADSGDRCCELPNTIATECVDGGCEPVACAPGFDNCDGDPSTGCEQSIDDDPSHCGACDRACNLPHVAQHQCVSGQCRVAGCNPVTGTCTGCEDGYGNCQGLHANGCETALDSLTNCGACGASCVRANASTSCDDGVCNFECSPGYLSCDFEDDTGCESSVTTVERCRGCTVQCDADEFCGTDGCAPLGDGCGDPAEQPCGDDGACVPIVHDGPADSFEHCGGCGSSCGPVPHATVRCGEAGCEIADCDEGYADCDGSLANGCEVDLNTSSQHCGECDDVCSPANATGVCIAGSCEIDTCDEDYDSCDGDPATGCESHLLSDDFHCGGCGAACIPFVAPFCRGGCCAWWSC